MVTNREDVWKSAEALLERSGLPRTRENLICMIWGEVPETWDEDCEEQLPPDMRVYPAPHYPMGH